MIKIQIKRGSKVNLPDLANGEYGITTDTDELFIGGSEGNLQIPLLGADGKLPEGKEAKLTLSEVMSPQMTRLVGNVSIYSCVYNIDLEICNMTYTRNPVQEPEPEPDPENPDEGGDTGEGGEGGADEPEWDGVSFLFHVVFVNSSTDFVPMVPYVDRFEVQTELPTEIEDTIAVGEKFRMDTPDLTLSGTFTFPVTVTDEHFVTVTNFTNYASLSTQGLNNLSGSLTNQTAPSTDFLLGWDRLDGGYENFVHMGFMNFNEVGIKSKYLEFSDGGSSQTFSSTQLEAEKLHLEAANIAAGARVELTADEMNLFDSSISAGNSILQASATGGTLTLTVNNKIDDGHSGVLSDEGVVVGVSPNKLNIRGKIEILNKPIEGDLPQYLAGAGSWGYFGRLDKQFGSRSTLPGGKLERECCFTF